MINQAVILCGGQGTRLRKITESRPKVMIQVGAKPLLEDQIGCLKKGGVGKIVLCTGYMSEVIERHFGDGSRFGVSVCYSREDALLGTAGAVRNIKCDLDDVFFVVYGDVFFRMDIGKLTRFHEEKKACATAVLHKSTHPVDSDVVEIDSDNRIIEFKRRKVGEGESVLTNAAFLVLNRSFLPLISPNKQLDFSLDIFPQAVKDVLCYGYVTDEYILDIGTEDRYEQLLRDLGKGLG